MFWEQVILNKNFIMLFVAAVIDDSNGVLNKGAVVAVLTVGIEVKLTIEGIGLLLMIGDMI